MMKGSMHMAMVQSSVVVGVFQDIDQARRAIDDLRRNGFTEDEVGFLTRATTTAEQGDEAGDTVASAAGGAVQGGVIGGVLGAAASLLIPGIGPAIAGGILAATLGGAAIGAAAGGVIGVLTGIGVPEEEANFYQQELGAGHPIIMVKVTSPDSQADALEILRRNGAYDASTKSGIINARPPLRPYGDTLPPDLEDTSGSGAVV
jgi:Heat induced stress protein YflT